MGLPRPKDGRKEQEHGPHQGNQQEACGEVEAVAAAMQRGEHKKDHRGHVKGAIKNRQHQAFYSGKERGGWAEGGGSNQITELLAPPLFPFSRPRRKSLARNTHRCGQERGWRSKRWTERRQGRRTQSRRIPQCRDPTGGEFRWRERETAEMTPDIPHTHGRARTRARSHPTSGDEMAISAVPRVERRVQTNMVTIGPKWSRKTPVGSAAIDNSDAPTYVSLQVGERGCE